MNLCNLANFYSNIILYSIFTPPYVRYFLQDFNIQFFINFRSDYFIIMFFLFCILLKSLRNIIIIIVIIIFLLRSSDFIIHCILPMHK